VHYLIDCDVLGTREHLVVVGDKNGSKARWINYVPEGVWYLSGKLKDDGWCLDTLLRLNHINIDLLPDERYKNVIETVMSGSNVSPPWSKVMKRGHHIDHVKKIVDQINEAISSLDESYYRDTWVPETAIFDRLNPAYIDEALWREWMLREVGNKHVIKTFKPTDGVARHVEYNRFGTRTGRLTVARGPNILTLRKDARNIVKSRYPFGSVAMYDFSALEVRLVLYEAGYRCDDVDLYGFLRDELYKGKVERDAIKQAVISELYGQNKFALGDNLGIGGKVLDRFVRKIKTYFQFDNLKKRTKDGYVSTGYVTNRYGRHITIDEPLDHIIFNSYVQSTGVDVTLLGFEELCKRLPEGCVPLYLLHDALLIDCPSFDALEKVIWLKVPGYVQRWPLKLEQVSVNGVCSQEEAQDD